MSQVEYSSTYDYAYPTKTISPIPDSSGTYGLNDELETTTTYDPNTGLTLSVTDPNGAVTEMEYDDPLLRPTKVITASGTALEAETITEYGAGTSAATRWVKVKSQIDATNWKEGLSWFDGLGRTIRSQSVDSESGDVFALTCFDAIGRPSKSSNPFRGYNSSSHNCSTTNGTNDIHWTTNTFDTAGRPWKVTTPDNAEVETTYGLAATGGYLLGSAVTVEDQAGKLRRSVTNSLGQLKRVDEPNSSNALGSLTAPNQDTTYDYDYLNNLTTVTQGSQTRTFTYDALSRLKSAVNPESGTINYTYDANSNLATKTDARSITTTYSYDRLNRVYSRDYSDSTPDVTYYYDNLTNAKGKLLKVTNGTGMDRSTTEYTSFDILGRVTASKQTTDGVTYGNGSTDCAMTYTYNLGGALIEQQYPSCRVVKNELDVSGDLASVTSKENSSAIFKTYVNDFTYNAAGAVTSLKLGNGKFESTTFNSRLQPTQIALGHSETDTSLLKLVYGYGTTANNGNVLTQDITVKRPGTSDLVFNQTYAYDELNRLKVAEEKTGSTTNWKQTFTFDRYGNRRFDEANTTMPTSFSNQALTNPTISTSNNRLTSTGWSYDSAGNTIGDPDGRQFTYDAENKQVEVKNSSNASIGTYFFDGDGKRVKKVVPSTGEIAVFVYDAGAKLIGEYSTIVQSADDAKVQYLTQDNLGTPRINTDVMGVVTSRSDYLPYGDEVVGLGGRSSTEKYVADDVRHGFTGYENDGETDLEYAKARMYASILGRFTSVDAVNTVTPTKVPDPQQQNLYIYVRNNPLYFIDPSGMVIKVRNLSEEQQAQWQEIVKLATLTDADGNFVNPELNRLYQRLESDSRTFFIDGANLGQGIAGRFEVEKFSSDGKDFTEASITLNFDLISDMRTTTTGTYDKSFEKYAGLFGKKDSPIRRMAETFGHEAAHAEHALNNPAEAVSLQLLINSSTGGEMSERWRKYAIDKMKIKNSRERSKFLPPPDLVEKTERKDRMLTATERYAQERQKLLNSELQYGRSISKCVDC